jgi:hypothetical protein
MTTATNPTVEEDIDFDVVLKQHLSEREFRDEEGKTTLRVVATSLQTVGQPGIQRALRVEIESDRRLENGDKLRVAKTLSANDPPKVDEASIEILRSIENYRPGFTRPLAEFTVQVTNGLVVGASKREGKNWKCFVELVENSQRLRCAVGDFELFYEFRVALTGAGNF